MKKYLVIILVLVIALGLVACNPSTGSGETTGTQGEQSTQDGTTDNGTESETNGGGGGVSNLPDPNAPSWVTLIMGEKTLELGYGSADWDYISSDGEDRWLVADGPHPLDVKETLDVMVIEDTDDSQVLLHFWCDSLPDKLTVGCWQYDCAPADAENTVEVIELTDSETYLELYGGYLFDLREDGEYIYMIRAEWDAEGFDALGFCGYLYYAFRTSVRGEVQ